VESAHVAPRIIAICEVFSTLHAAHSAVRLHQ
jgi:hypothetical protein